MDDGHQVRRSAGWKCHFVGAWWLHTGAMDAISEVLPPAAGYKICINWIEMASPLCVGFPHPIAGPLPGERGAKAL